MDCLWQHKGVTQEKGASRYRAVIIKNYKKFSLGFYDTAEEAALAYDEAARKFHGEFACVNFPLPGEQGCRERAAI